MKKEKDNFELTPKMKAILDERLEEGEKTYITAEESIIYLEKKYEIKP